MKIIFSVFWGRCLFIFLNSVLCLNATLLTTWMENPPKLFGYHTLPAALYNTSDDLPGVQHLGAGNLHPDATPWQQAMVSFWWPEAPAPGGSLVANMALCPYPREGSILPLLGRQGRGVLPDHTALSRKKTCFVRWYFRTHFLFKTLCTCLGR